MHWGSKNPEQAFRILSVTREHWILEWHQSGCLLDFLQPGGPEFC